MNNEGSAVPIDFKQWCSDLTHNMVVRMVVGKRCFDVVLITVMIARGGDFKRPISRFFYLTGLLVVSDMVPLLKWFDLQGHRRTVKATAKEIDSLFVRWLHEHRIAERDHRVTAEG